jgi:hypothetical protein
VIDWRKNYLRFNQITNEEKSAFHLPRDRIPIRELPRDLLGTAKTKVSE